MVEPNYSEQEVPPQPIQMVEIAKYCVDKFASAFQVQEFLQSEPFDTLLSEYQSKTVMRIYLIERHERDKRRFVDNVR